MRDSDSVRVSYRELFDLPIALPGKKFFADAVNSVKSGDAGEFLRSSEPRNTLYFKFLEKYKHAGSAQDKMRILCNMERSRWAVADAPDKHEKYVLLNIPSQELDAVDGKHTDRMRVVFGSKETKTPLLQSYIERMDVNPQWIIPQSIVKKSVARNAGNAARRAIGVAGIRLIAVLGHHVVFVGALGQIKLALAVSHPDAQL